MNIHRGIVRSNGASHVVDRPTPRPDRGEVLLAPEVVSLCGTDLQMLRGLRNDPSPILGHEGACRVVEVGPEVTNVSVGDRVVVNPTHPQDPSFLLGHNVEGLFQQRTLIPASAVSGGLLIGVGPMLDSATATLVEPLAVTDYALECLMLSGPADALVIVGDGLIGHLATIRALSLGRWSRVVLAHTSDRGRAWSERTWPDSPAEFVRFAELAGLGLGGAVASLIATHRDRSVEALHGLASAQEGTLRAVHLTGGLPDGARSNLFPAVDLPGVRAVNTGGPWPPQQVRAGTGATTVTFTGNRGVTGSALRQSALDLEHAGPRFSSLITHRTDLEAGASLMNRMVATRSRHLPGGPVLRLVMTVNPDLETAGTSDVTVQQLAAAQNGDLR